ncbi:MAG: MBG domain-containing protein, partial [Candidatus Gastranaerophilaceae bacterium]
VLTPSNTGSFTVNKKALTITADNFTKLKNDPNPTFTDTVTGLVASDVFSEVGTLDLATTATTRSLTGLYDIISSFSTHGTKYDNYNISLVNGTLTINKRNFYPANTDAGNILVEQALDIANNNSVDLITRAISPGGITQNTVAVMPTSPETPITFNQVTPSSENHGNVSTGNTSSSTTQPSDSSSNNTNVNYTLTSNNSSNNNVNTSYQQDKTQGTLDAVANNLNTLLNANDQNLFEIIAGKGLFDFILLK